jgi:DNA repair protein RadD
VYSAALGLRNIGPITLATIGSVIDLPHWFDDVPFVIVDEAHVVNAKSGRYEQFFSSLASCRILGLSATPWRLSVDNYGGAMQKFLTRTRPRVFNRVVYAAQIDDLMAQGYLMTPCYQIVPGFHRDLLEPNTTGSEFTDESVQRYYNQIGFADRLVRVVKRLQVVGRQHILVFTRFVEEAEELVQAVPGSALVTSETPEKERAAIVQDFKSGRVSMVANVNTLSTGFDFPALDTVVLARATLSLSLYAQQVGRVVRPAMGKPQPWVVDMVDQVAQFGKLEQLRLVRSGEGGRLWDVVSNGRRLTHQYLTARRHPRGKWGTRRG